MKRTHAAALLAIVIAVPFAASSLFMPAAKPCFIAGDTGYRISDDAGANIIVRIDNAAANPDLRLQLADNAAAADFVLVDDGDSSNACAGATAIRSIRLDPKAANPDLTVALSRAPAAHKIYVQSAGFSQQDAAALFAVIWRNEAKSVGSIREIASRN